MTKCLEVDGSSAVYEVTLVFVCFFFLALWFVLLLSFIIFIKSTGIYSLYLPVHLSGSSSQNTSVFLNVRQKRRKAKLSS